MNIIYIALVELEVFNAPRTHTLEVCEHLEKLGNKVLLLIPKLRQEKFKFSFDVVYVPFLGWGLFREFIYNIFLSIYLIFHIFKFKPDIIYEREIFNPLSQIISSIFKIKYFIEINGPSFSKNSLFKNYSIRLKIRKCSGIVVPSKNLRNSLIKTQNLAEDKIKFIANGFNPDIFYPMDKFECRRKICLKEDRFYIGYTGGIYHAYDFDILVDYIDEFRKDIDLIVVTKNISCIKSRENIRIYNNVPYKEVPIYINSFDICILPLSKSGIKTMEFLARIKLYEYIACNKLVLVPYIEKAEVPDDLKNFIVSYKYGDKKDFCNKLHELYLHREFLQKNKGQLKKVLNKYTWEETTKKIIKFISE